MLPTKYGVAENKRSPDVIGLFVFLVRYTFRNHTHKFIIGFLVFLAVSATLLGFRHHMQGPERASLFIIQSPTKPRPIAEERAPESFEEPTEEAHPTTRAKAGDEITTEQYIKKYAPIARKEKMKYGVPASITLAQGIIESRSGNSKLAKVANNHFGIKCFSKRHSACCVKSKDDSNNDSFVLFQSPYEAYEAHSQFLRKDRYKPLFKYGMDYRMWAYGLKKCGYATDRTYPAKLISIIQRYNLHKYDR